MMKTISAENLPLIAHNQLPVVTTELLAQLYGTETANIKMNFSRNTKRFVQGKHFFKLEGDDLREFKHSMSLRPSVSDEVTESYPVKIARNVRSLILWTERGAARHAKMLETDQAWEVFEKLEDCYFSQKQPVPARQTHPAIPFPKERRFIVTVSPDGTADTQPLPDDVFVGKVSSILSDLRQMGWIIIKRDRLVETIATW
ncbi:ORF6N domain-containing protein [Salmonella enterica]|nr:ORF6N domain-containing protein [Salmonella enterica]